MRLKNNKITKLLDIEYSVIQAGMVWVSGWKLASAVSKCGGLGIIGAGSMKPQLLEEHISKFRKSTDKSFGVNVPLLREDSPLLIQCALQNGCRIFFTSAGSPYKFIEQLKAHDCKVVHIVSSVKQAQKAMQAGVDAIVGEGVEAGGHNGAEEITTLSLIPQLVDAVDIPVIAAGGIATGAQIAAAICLGAEGVQIGTLFAAAEESSAHINYKTKIIEANDSATILAFRKLGLTRMLRNNFAEKALLSEKEGWSSEQTKELLGKKREQLGIFEGDLVEGELEAGQCSSLVKSISPSKIIFDRLIEEYNSTISKITTSI